MKSFGGDGIRAAKAGNGWILKKCCCWEILQDERYIEKGDGGKL